MKGRSGNLFDFSIGHFLENDSWTEAGNNFRYTCLGVCATERVKDRVGVGISCEQKATVNVWVMGRLCWLPRTGLGPTIDPPMHAVI